MQCFNSLQKYATDGEIYSGVVYDRKIIRVGKMGLLGPLKSVSGKDNREDNEKRAIRRAKTNITDYVKTNPELKYFVTYTLAPDKVNRYNEKEIYKKIRDWLSNNVKRKGLMYILVPEQHKDGAWHFHGFMNRPLEWKYGFCRVTEVDRQKDMNGMINYTVSYVKKGMIKFNGRKYLHSQNLSKPGKIYSNVDFEKEPGRIVELKDLKVRMKVQDGKTGRTPSLPPLAPAPLNLRSNPRKGSEFSICGGRVRRIGGAKPPNSPAYAHGVRFRQALRLCALGGFPQGNKTP